MSDYDISLTNLLPHIDPGEIKYFSRNRMSNHHYPGFGMLQDGVFFF
jgi:hypothetical protein